MTPLVQRALRADAHLDDAHLVVGNEPDPGEQEQHDEHAETKKNQRDQ
jgi:hypothetical protein